jgi:flagellar biosynthesis protein FlhB
VSESNSSERTFEATERRVDQARQRGDMPVAREAPIATLYIAALAGLLLLAGSIAGRICQILLPLLDQPEQLLDLTDDGWRAAAEAVGLALVLVLAPFFAMTMMGSLLPYLLQNAITMVPERIVPKWSHLSPSRGFKRIFGFRSLFEFAKSLLKLATVAAAAFVVCRPIYEHSVGYVSMSLAFLPDLMLRSVATILLAATLISVAIAGVDTPFQHWIYRRRLRMTLQEMREDMRESEGDPLARGRRRILRRKRARSRMMHDVPKATVIITNPTHVAVALRYRRGEDKAPVVVAKGVELIALRIREVAHAHGIGIVENPPLARILNSTVEVGNVIPTEHFDIVAKIIGTIWARRMPGASAPNTRLTASPPVESNFARGSTGEDLA